MSAWDAIWTYCALIGAALTVGMVIIIGAALLFWLRGLADDQDRRGMVNRSRRLEDVQVAALDELWHLPARGHR